MNQKLIIISDWVAINHSTFQRKAFNSSITLEYRPFQTWKLSISAPFHHVDRFYDISLDEPQRAKVAANQALINFGARFLNQKEINLL